MYPTEPNIVHYPNPVHLQESPFPIRRPVRPAVRLIPGIVPGIDVRRLYPAPPSRVRIGNRQPPGAHTRAVRASAAHAPIIAVPRRVHLIDLIAVAALYAHE